MENEQNRSSLEVNGARQVGKTYIINKFVDEHFKHKIYINFFEQSGKQFLECYKQATSWIPGTKRPEHPLHDALRLFEPDFIDSDDTVIIIDEIQVFVPRSQKWTSLISNRQAAVILWILDWQTIICPGLV